jgi:hypothetical protein
MSQNSNYNKNPQSGVTFAFRLSETLFAVLLTGGVSFGSGFAIANSHNQAIANSHNQSVNCSVQNTSIPQDK